jgi:hypothetical protein
MTFRPPAMKPTRRRTRQMDTRRTIFLNVAFGFASVAAVALLGGVLFANWYADHGVPIASVNGVAISKDAVRDRAAVNLARDKRLTADYEVLRNQARITADEYSSLSSTLTTKEDPTTLYQDALSQLTQEQTLQQYADQHGIKVTDADVDAQVAEDGTQAEMRHVMVVEVDPTPTPPSSIPTAEQLAAAQKKAQDYVDSIKSGSKKWDDVSTEASAAGNMGAQGTSGDLGLSTRDALGLDPALVDAIFNLKNVNDVTEVVNCDDGLYRFATITSIVAANKDSGWKDAIGQTASGDAYRASARAEALTSAVKKSIESQLVSGPTTQRHVLEIAVSPGYGQLGDGPEFKLKIMVFAPNHDTSSASSLPSTDQAWVDAKTRADAAVATLQSDPTKFGTLARDTTNNDDPYVASAGGELPWISGPTISGDPSSGTALGMPSLAQAVAQPGLAPGIIGPILEETMGYVVADYEGTRPAPAQRMADAQIMLATGADFATEVAQYSETADAIKGGDMGWISRYILPTDLEAAIFQTPVGGTSRMIQNSNGYWIFKVLAEETRTADATQQAKMKLVTFNAWLIDLTDAANVWTDTAALTALTPASTP